MRLIGCPCEPEGIDSYHRRKRLPRKLPAHRPTQYIPHAPSLLVHSVCTIEFKSQRLTIECAYIHRSGTHISPSCDSICIQRRRRTGSPQDNHVGFTNCVVDDMNLLQRVEWISYCFAAQNDNQHARHWPQHTRCGWAAIEKRRLVHVVVSPVRVLPIGAVKARVTREHSPIWMRCLEGGPGNDDGWSWNEL